MRRHGRLWAALATLGVILLLPTAAHAVIPSYVAFDVAAGAKIKPVFASVTGECTGKIVDTDGQTMSVLVAGTAQSQGAAASTGIGCTILQDPDGDGIFDYHAGGCRRALPGVVAACTAIVPGVSFDPFKVCAVATVHLLNGDVHTVQGLNCS